MRILALTIGTVLLAFGIFGLLTGGLSFRHKDQVINTDSIHISREATSRIGVPPVAGVLAMLAGGGLVFAGLRSR